MALPRTTAPCILVGHLVQSQPEKSPAISVYYNAPTGAPNCLVVTKLFLAVGSRGGIK